MNTKTFEPFEVMSTEMLAKIEGGKKVSAGEAGSALAICTAGGVYGAQYCTAAWALLRTH